MANYSRWEDIKKRRDPVGAGARAGIVQDLALGQLIYDLRTAAGLSQRELAERMGTTQSVIDGANRTKRIARAVIVVSATVVEACSSDAPIPAMWPRSSE